MELKTFLIPIAALIAMGAGFQARAAVLATVGGKSITTQELKGDYEASLTNKQRENINQDGMLRRNILNNAINTKVLVLAAKKAGFERDADYRKAVMQFERNYLASKFMEKAVEPKLTRTNIKKFFNKNKSFFDSTQVCAHHIVVSSKRKAEMVLRLAKRKGANFEKLAMKYSLDPTVRENKGNLGCFTRDRMAPTFSAAAFSMRVHEIRGPVRTMYGYHIIRVDRIKAGHVPTYAEVEEKVKNTYRLKLVSDMIQHLRKVDHVKINEEALNKLRL